LNPEWVLYFPGRWSVEAHNPQLVDYVKMNYVQVDSISSAEGLAWLMKKK
jgi:hypothetical protein